MTQETSQQAYFTEVLPTLADRHQEVLKYLATVENASNMEISEALKWSVNRVTPRTNELVKEKLIEQVGERKCRITGRNVKVWRVKNRIVTSDTSKDPSIYRCHKCPRTAVAFKDSQPVCLDHSKEKVVAPSLF